MSESSINQAISIVGVILGAILGFVGSYIIQRSMWKRQVRLEVAKSVYEPLYEQLQKMLKNIENYEILASLEDFERVKFCPCYFDIPAAMQESLSQLANDLRTYDTLIDNAHVPIKRITREVMEQHGFPKEHWNDDIWYKASLEGRQVKGVTLQDGILKGKTPRELLADAANNIANVTIGIGVPWCSPEEAQKLDAVCKKALQKSRSEPILVQIAEQGPLLVGRLNQMLDSIRSERKKIMGV